MSKKNRGEKEASRLRREVEILRTQLKAARPEERRVEKTEESHARAQNQTSSSSDFRTTPVADYSYLRGDLVKTAILSALSFASIFLIYFYQGKTDQIFKLLSPILRR